MKDIPQGVLFDQDGITYQCISKPRRFWPCQNCALYWKCNQGYGTENWPACKHENRADRTDVVFVFPLPKQRRRDPRQEQ